MTWPNEFLLFDPRRPWSLDISTAGLNRARFDGLAWAQTFAHMDALVAGEAVNRTQARTVGHFWLRNPELSPDLETKNAITQALTHARALAHDVRAGRITNVRGEPFTDVIHIGVGGSLLGPKLLVNALTEDNHGTPQGLTLHFSDNLDLDSIARMVGRLGPRFDTTLLLVVSKSGTTTEVLTAHGILRQKLEARGLQSACHCVAITQPGSALAQQAHREHWLATLPVFSFVGGRFSTTSVVGLFPSALAGIDIDAIIAGAQAMDAWTIQHIPTQNPAALLAGVWSLCNTSKAPRNLVVLPYTDRLEELSRWLQQVVMESIGKRHSLQGTVIQEGMTVFGGKGSTDQHSYLQQLLQGRDNALVFFVRALQHTSTTTHDPLEDPAVTDLLNAFLLGIRRALKDMGRPSVTLTLDEVSAYTVGGVVALFERAVGFYASLLGVNAYDQPGVEAGKSAARQILVLMTRVREQLGPTPRSVAELSEACEADPTEVFLVLQQLSRDGSARWQGDPVTGTWSHAG